MAYIIQTTLTLGCVYSLVALALFLSYRILDIADLTTDGCYVLGMAVSVTCAYYGHPLLAILLATISGACAGFVTAFLQTRLGVPSILAGKFNVYNLLLNKTTFIVSPIINFITNIIKKK